MTKVLSPEEMNALMSGAALVHAGKGLPASDAATVYNFRRPDRVSKDQIRSLHFMHERFARNVSTSL